jgi:small basic protein (TIGR04137 family)
LKGIAWADKLFLNRDERTADFYDNRLKTVHQNHPKMTLDKSLKVRAGAIKTRNVMTRAERIKRLQDLNKWSDDSIVLGMAKVRVPKISLKKKKKVKKEEEADDKKKKKK